MHAQEVPAYAMPLYRVTHLQGLFAWAWPLCKQAIYLQYSSICMRGVGHGNGHGHGCIGFENASLFLNCTNINT